MAIQKKRSPRRKAGGLPRDIDPAVILRKSMPVLIFLSIILLMGVLIRTIFLSMPYFVINKVKVVSIDALFTGKDTVENMESVKNSKGKNIFHIDIQKIAQEIRKKFPELKKVTVKRVMPDILEIRVVIRIPIAVIKLNEYYPVDYEGVLLPPGTKLSKPLPVIEGISTGLSRPKTGDTVNSSQFKSIQVLLKKMRSMEILTKYGIERLEILNADSLVLFIKNGIEVRIGQGDITEKLKKLETILKDPKVDKRVIKYIDLRFKDAVIGVGPR